MNISDVERSTGLPSTTIRYYEGRGLISVKRKENGYRDYDEESIHLLRKIRFLREIGIPLSDIRLWRDGVVSRDELLAKRLRTMDDDSKKSRDCRAICARVFGKEIRISLHTEEAAFGAALFGGVSAGILSRDESYRLIQYCDLP